MKYSELSNSILNRAEQLHNEKQTQYLSPLCIFVAIAELCNAPYTGIQKKGECYYPEWYEEERLRYLYKKFFRGSAGLVGNYIRRRLGKELLQYDADFLAERFENFEAEARDSGKDMISADIIFLFAISAIREMKYLTIYPQFRDGFSIKEILADVDKNIYDFVIAEIGEIQKKLQLKADEAKAKRDWKPAKKLMEPEELLDLICNSVRFAEKEDRAELIFPCFFGELDGELRLTVTWSSGTYFLWDNGCAIAQLKKRVGEDYGKVLKKVCHPIWIKQGEIRGRITQISEFMYYLQELIFIANADLICNHVEQAIYPYLGIDFCSDSPFTKVSNADLLLASLKQSVDVIYDQNQGLVIKVDATYSKNNTTIAFQVESLSEHKIRISDAAKGRVEGEILESFYWENDDISLYSDFLAPFLERFGGDCDGKDIGLTADLSDGNFLPVLFRFINLAVLLSELGYWVELPERK